MLYGLHLFENLHLHCKKEEEGKDYVPVPKYTPELFKKAASDPHHHHHHHVYHLHRRASNVDSVCSKCSTELEAESSVFVAEPGTERRGIFRTLEPIWVCTITSAPTHKKDANAEGLITLDDLSQKILEKAYSSKAASCDLRSDSTIGICTVQFNQNEDSSAATEPTRSTKHHLIYDKDIQRMSAPVWWFEKKGLDGKIEVGRFDRKNQVRLEAYGDNDSTLALTDKAFSDPFTVAINKSRKDDKTEWQGFMYLNTIPRMGVQGDNSADAVDPDADEDDDGEYHDLCIQGKDNFPNFNTFEEEAEQEEEREEEAYRKTHIKNNHK